MRTRAWVGLLLVGIATAGCGGTGEDAAATTSSAPSSSSSPPPPSSTAASTSDFELAVTICTEGLVEPDAAVLDAANGARNGTRSAAEVAAAFQSAQDAVEELARQAEDAGYESLGPSLQTYADTLGRARVVGDVGLTEITDARSAIDVACYVP